MWWEEKTQSTKSRNRCNMVRCRGPAVSSWDPSRAWELQLTAAAWHWEKEDLTTYRQSGGKIQFQNLTHGFYWLTFAFTPLSSKIKTKQSKNKNKIDKKWFKLFESWNAPWRVFMCKDVYIVLSSKYHLCIEEFGGDRQEQEKKWRNPSQTVAGILGREYGEMTRYWLREQKEQNTWDILWMSNLRNGSGFYWNIVEENGNKTRNLNLILVMVILLRTSS